MKEIHATKADLVRWAQGLPVEQIKLSHIKSTFATWDDIEMADRITVKIDGSTRVLKDRWHRSEHAI
jgi:hypothetical protein